MSEDNEDNSASNIDNDLLKCLKVEEYSGVRRIIELNAYSMDGLERFCIGASGAIFAFIFSVEGRQDFKPYIALLPLTITLYGYLRFFWQDKIVGFCNEFLVIHYPQIKFTEYFRNKNKNILFHSRNGVWIILSLIGFFAGLIAIVKYSCGEIEEAILVSFISFLMLGFIGIQLIAFLQKKKQ
uniref:hypothetical protein n=1 Tax=Acidocella sp. C78 TaxID=1671486 RepID=UPI00191BBB65|nr:hypothetical protein [Acidocella sp. C78]